MHLDSAENASAASGSVHSARSYPKYVARPIDFFWVYALTATDPRTNVKACYVGQTHNLKRRMHDHFSGQWGGGIYETVIGRSSSLGLFGWAGDHQAEVRCIALCFLECTRQEAEQFEGYWVHLALAAGYEMPGYYRKDFLPMPRLGHNQPNIWPDEIIVRHALPIADVVSNNIEPVLITERFSTVPKSPTKPVKLKQNQGKKWTQEEESRLVAHFMRYGHLRRLETVHERTANGIKKRLWLLSKDNNALLEKISSMREFKSLLASG